MSCNIGDKTRTHGKSKTSGYRIWALMIQRCTNSNNPAYPSYGGRGITVCDRWSESFENFLEDMGERPETLTIDRIYNNLGYYKENCRWTNRKEQSRNRRKRIDNSSGVTGVYWKQSNNKYQAQIRVDGICINLGYYEDLEDAALARKDAEKKYFNK